ncbi:MAG: Fe-S cluster assembly ATPase SufC [Bacilli bacterium]|nr:Fe-S cluster assembly ATPase SufC [Bacilli bacterium]
MLQIKNLTASVERKKIINGLDLEINDSEIHVLMGPNGVGKSTICKILLKDENYTISSGVIIFNGTKINDLNTTEVARLGIYLVNQNPIGIEGVTNAEMLRTALSDITGERVGIFEFNKKLENICKELDIPKEFIHREINVGMSGGERKKNELMHLWMLEPKFIILDELDSGLDVDALKVVSESINKYYEKFKPSILIITHHNKILEYIKPHKVHVLKDGKIIKSGDITLAKEIENSGFTAF